MTDLVTIARFDRVAEAELCQLALAQAGIAAYLDNANLLAANMMLANAVGGIKLQVLASDSPAALEILQSGRLAASVAESPTLATASHAEIVFDCSECGATIRFAAKLAGKCEVCPECHEMIDVPDALPATAIAPAIGSTAADLDGRTAAPVAPRAGGDWWEVLIVLALAYLPYLYVSLEYLASQPSLAAATSTSPTDYYDDGHDYPYELLYSATQCLLVLYLIWRNGDSWLSFGLTKLHWFRDSALAVGCLFADRLALFIGWLLVVGNLRPERFVSDADGAFTDLAVTAAALPVLTQVTMIASTLLSAFCEELVYRCYLITRMAALLGSSWIAVLVAATLFGSVHLYQGSEGALQAWFMGLAYGGLFLWLRRIWPLAIAHAAHNLLIAYS